MHPCTYIYAHAPRPMQPEKSLEETGAARAAGAEARAVLASADKQRAAARQELESAIDRIQVRQGVPVAKGAAVLRCPAPSSLWASRPPRPNAAAHMAWVTGPPPAPLPTRARRHPGGLWGPG